MRLAQSGRAGGKAQHRSQGGQGIFGGAGQENAHLFAHGGDIQYTDHRTNLGTVIIALARTPDDTQHLAGPERHLDKSTQMTAALGRFVVEQAIKRLRRQHANKITFVEKAIGHIRL